MSYELQKIVAFVLKTQGIREITESDFVNYLSVRKRMVTPAGAKKILERCITTSTLIKDGNVLRPGFELDDIAVEPDFKIPPETVASEKVDVFLEIVNYISDRSGKEKKEVVAEINRIAEETCTLPLVAALIYAKMSGIEAKKFYDTVEKEILGETEK